MELDGIPKAGSLVKVKWDDNTIYTCTFLGFNKTFLYTVILEVFFSIYIIFTHQKCFKA